MDHKRLSKVNHNQFSEYTFIHTVNLFLGKIHVVGGSDGSNSLKSVEILDNNNFILGSTMSIGRANVGVVSFNNRLYAVGGFSGKKFLDTFEYLDPKSEEWCSYVPAEEVQKALKNGNTST